LLEFVLFFIARMDAVLKFDWVKPPCWSKFDKKIACYGLNL